MATFPTLKVEIAFASDPLDTTPTWTDVSAYVRAVDGLNISRGRTDPWSPDTAGRVTLTLSNRDRRFDSTYSSGPYYGNLKPRKQIRVTATWASTDYTMFTGFVGPWPQAFSDAGKDATVQLEAYDALDWSAGTTLSTDPVYDYVTAIATPTYWLRQADEDGWYDITGATSWSRVGSALELTPPPAAGIKSPGLVFRGLNGVWATTSLSALSAWSIAFWFRIDNAALLNVNALSYASGSSTQSQFNFGVTPSIVFSSDDGGGNTANLGIDYPPVGAWHHFVFTSSETVYVDGVAHAFDYFNNWTGSPKLLIQQIGANNVDSVVSTTYTNGVALSDVLVLPAAMSADQVADFYNLSRGFVEESSAARVTRLLDDAGWPSAWRDLTADPRATVGELLYSNAKQLRTALQEVERSEQGRIFAAKDGNLTLHSRYHAFEVTRGSTSQATFSDDGSDFKYVSFGYTEDDFDVRNDITVSSPAGESRATDATSITTYGRRSETINTILSTVGQRADMAAGLVVLWKDQALRINRFTVGVPSSWVTLLGLELDDRITVEITPMGVGSQLVKELTVDSISWAISDQGWWLALGASPVPADLFVLDSSSLDGTDILGF